ncbi:Panacea domain-containing protein [Sphingorhabdus arenilitoris]|uniref:Panacea domain-containing protein n=1 Tax=Sphingorhabdus arenilitoris TaxID=1490041 RepID=A0ABV8RI41_9SPHN
MTSPSTYSVKEVANWILDFCENHGERPTNMALNKLIYFAYEYALLKESRKLTLAKIEAWDHGPVFREVYSAFKKFGADPITDRATRYNTETNSVENVNPTIELSDQAIIVEAIEPLIRLPAFILREMSHDLGGAWSKVWNHKSSSNPGMEISDELILESKMTSR